MTTRARLQFDEANAWADAQLARPLIVLLRGRRAGRFLLAWMLMVTGVGLVAGFLCLFLLLSLGLQWLTGSTLLSFIVLMLLVTLWIAAATMRPPRVVVRLACLQNRLQEEAWER